MATLRTARDRARSEVTAEIVSKAREHLAVFGAAGLSLRAVARDLGMVSSAVYRYFETRDVLLTALIVEAYDSLGVATERSVSSSARKPPRERWVKAAETIRGWALEHPQEYALLYGSPVPGYAAPQVTVVPGTRVSLALVQIVIDAHAAGLLRGSTSTTSAIALSKTVNAEIKALSQVLATDVATSAVFATLLAWTQLFGLLSFELFGQTKGLVSDHAAFFRDAATAMASQIGL
jgi:AcrR family transcriptional regulator